MEKKNPPVFRRNIFFLSSEPMERILPVLKRFFPSEKPLIDLLSRKDIDYLLEKMISVDSMKISNSLTNLLKEGKSTIQDYGFFPPVELFFTFSGVELYESMVERIYKDLKKGGMAVSLSKIWSRISRTFGNNPISSRYFSKELLFKIRQRLKNYLDKDGRFHFKQTSPKKIEIGLVEWTKKT
ncbi:hypothetical protein ACFL35_10395 [Candidatus Riflebacteria bacterium]